MSLSIQIPVNSAVKKYLEIKLGKNYNLCTDDWFGIIVYNFLINKTNKNFSITPKMRDQKEIFFEVTLSIGQIEKAGIYLTEKQISSINNIVEKIFREEMYYSAIVNKNIYSIDYRITINNILDAYDITEEDLPFDTLIKDFDRKKGNIVPNLYF